ncbi:MAG: cytochrome d ubiquinol oxidase subunit II [Verrucomicrobiota bacterium JB022]|nr:cytochrome d ubiquinol oxidase subunit II [Verrucomicrobiota bacterium JB022]
MDWLPVDLNTIWFVLVGILFAGYAILDGFDLGVGVLHLFARTDEERRVNLNAIGPVWDGNEVWLVTGGGALFAAFPEVYATVFSGFYLAFFALLTGLIFRAVAIDFRSKLKYRWWRLTWDVSFSLASILCSFIIGVTMGNIARGVPLDADFEYAGGFFTLFNAYSLWMGVTTVALFAMHGAIYLHLKTEGNYHQRVKAWIQPCMIAFILCYALFTLATLLYVPHITDALRAQPAYFVLVVLVILAIANIPRSIYLDKGGQAFASSVVAMGLLMGLFGIGMYPYLVYSLPNPEHSLDIYNGASSDKSLGIMAIIAAIGVPLVLGYTAVIYWIFRGKVRLDEMSY